MISCNIYVVFLCLLVYQLLKPWNLQSDEPHTCSCDYGGWQPLDSCRMMAGLDQGVIRGLGFMSPSSQSPSRGLGEWLKVKLIISGQCLTLSAWYNDASMKPPAVCLENLQVANQHRDAEGWRGYGGSASLPLCFT